MIWTNLEYDWEVVAQVVDAHSSSSVIGELVGLDPAGCEVTEGYYSDTRVSGRVTTRVPLGESDGYVPNARICIVLRVPRHGWERQLLTGFVTDYGESEEGGSTIREYSLDSSLWGIAEDMTLASVTCAAGAKALTVAKRLMDSRRIEYDVSDAQDRTISKPTVYEPGTALLHLLFDIMSGYNRIGVRGDGPILIKRYTAPSKLSPSATIDPYDHRTLVVGDVSDKDESSERPGAAIVTANVSKTKTVGGKTTTTHETRAGSYLAPDSHETSRNTRGYLRFAKDTYSGSKEEPSVSELQSAAKTVWSNNQDKGRSHDLTVLYMDLHEGDVVELVRKDGTTRKCLVQTVTTNLDPRERTQRLTLKEV